MKVFSTWERPYCFVCFFYFIILYIILPRHFAKYHDQIWTIDEPHQEKFTGWRHDGLPHPLFNDLLTLVLLGRFVENVMYYNQMRIFLDFTIWLTTTSNVSITLLVKKVIKKDSRRLPRTNDTSHVHTIAKHGKYDCRNFSQMNKWHFKSTVLPFLLIGSIEAKYSYMLSSTQAKNHAKCDTWLESLHFFDILFKIL